VEAKDKETNNLPKKSKFSNVKNSSQNILAKQTIKLPSSNNLKPPTPVKKEEKIRKIRL